MGKMTGSEAIIECLLEEGVKTIFGFPGGAVIDLYDTLMDSKVNHVLVRHEQGAVTQLTALPVLPERWVLHFSLPVPEQPMGSQQ